MTLNLSPPLQLVPLSTCGRLDLNLQTIALPGRLKNVQGPHISGHWNVVATWIKIEQNLFTVCKLYKKVSLFVPSFVTFVGCCHTVKFIRSLTLPNSNSPSWAVRTPIPVTRPDSALRSTRLHLLVLTLPCFSTYADFLCKDEIGVTALHLGKEQGEDWNKREVNVTLNCIRTSGTYMLRQYSMRRRLPQ